VPGGVGGLLSNGGGPIPMKKITTERKERFTLKSLHIG
jgi:hypothetical protein